MFWLISPVVMTNPLPNHGLNTTYDLALVMSVLLESTHCKIHRSLKRPTSFVYMFFNLRYLGEFRVVDNQLWFRTDPYQYQSFLEFHAQIAKPSRTFYESKNKKIKMYMYSCKYRCEDNSQNRSIAWQVSITFHRDSHEMPHESNDWQKVWRRYGAKYFPMAIVV